MQGILQRTWKDFLLGGKSIQNASLSPLMNNFASETQSNHCSRRTSFYKHISGCSFSLTHHQEAPAATWSFNLCFKLFLFSEITSKLFIMQILDKNERRKNSITSPMFQQWSINYFNCTSNLCFLQTIQNNSKKKRNL